MYIHSFYEESLLYGCKNVSQGKFFGLPEGNLTYENQGNANLIMSDNENGLSVSFSSASSRRTSSESLEQSFRKILNARDKGISTAFLERYAVTSRGLKVLRFLNVRRVCFTADPSNRGRVSGHCILLELRDKTLSFILLVIVDHFV